MSDTQTYAAAAKRAWQGFAAGRWMHHIDVRDFIQRNVTPYADDGSFLAGPSARTLAVWEKLQPLFKEEIGKGVLDVDAKTPSTIVSHEPGYIDRSNKVIVGLQTNRPFKRALMPLGGWRMIEYELTTAGFAPDPAVKEIFTKYRKTHNDGVFDVYTPEIMACRKSGIINRPAGCLRPRPHHWRLPAAGAVRYRPAAGGEAAGAGAARRDVAYRRGDPRARGAVGADAGAR